ncbi:hypothetical protein ZWY2020_049084 [Hordeum vulgare]|nr:hypothetical protein ZWY2020_049084 [Hordeum vulgare]
MAASRPLPPPAPPGAAVRAGGGADEGDTPSSPQSGQAQPAAPVSAGGYKRHGEFHGIVQVAHRNTSTSGGGTARHTMHTSSPSHGRSGISLLLLVGGCGGRASSPCA